MSCRACNVSLYGCGGQGCAQADLRDRAMALGGPHAAMVARQTMGDILPRVVWPSTVDDLKRTLDVSFQTTDSAVTRCADLTPADRAAWELFFKSWVAYRNAPTPTFGLSNVYDEGLGFQASLAKWQEILRTKCTLPGPQVVDPTVETAAEASTLTTVKWVAGAVIVAAVALTVRSVLR